MCDKIGMFNKRCMPVSLLFDLFEKLPVSTAHYIDSNLMLTSKKFCEWEYLCLSRAALSVIMNNKNSVINRGLMKCKFTIKSYNTTILYLRFLLLTFFK